ncbi:MULTISPECIES: RraA family protein [Novosphingobium]|jgi:regulator of RNase E activity RraA|uniref:RraA family protein n=1 Tax=Novosphingobium TaxID=165696 RepID=UPI0022F250BA|nr:MULTISPECIES: RraA family protein [Novosphingobium]GLK46121.1 4-hydroxy-4-methyl-2-oxoglutarate aldolase [Novosphingobium resinovorum]
MTFDRHPMPPQAALHLVHGLSRVETSTLGHWRLWGLCDPALRPLAPGMKACGTIVTLALSGPDGALLHEALSHLRGGDVLVIDRLGDTRHAAVGGVVAAAAMLRGIAGIVVDGPVADLGEILETGLPVWARGVSARTTRRLGLGGRFNAAVSVGGVVARPGDIALCDADGVVFLSPEDAAGDIDRAEAAVRRETLIRDGLAKGIALEDLLAPPALAEAR